ncbi:hypothetical protein [Commensalibacter oyaizuii]|uniref:Uncharacterized protein n=1 Tax=Commensalibacter oyaizuii TaxID=3043873 RepID=A0ABT6Q4A2_9PROT|nr:hypothetical protein [Commensalibacter sp. TBRC 16381]MDI2091855.1 hypothetical protein [Commensalibacter sp. TBRC 16381]
MIRNNKYIIAIFIALITLPVAHGQERTDKDILKTKIWDWYIPPDARASSSYKKSKKCGNISLDIPNWVDIKEAQINIKKKLPHDDRVDFLSGGISFSITCKIQVNLNTDNIKFNDTTKLWELSKEDQEDYIGGTKLKSDQIYQLHTPNAFGWVHTMISFDVIGGSYTKIAKFCLFNNQKNKQLCGSGNPQYIPNRKQLGTTRFDYTPILIKILNTAQFLDDK